MKTAKTMECTEYFLALRNNNGYTGSYSTVCRVCRENGITLPKKHKPNSLTEADKDAQKSENLIKQDFTAEKPNEKWLSDITEVPCSDGKLYVSPVLDCFDGAIVGLTMDDNMRKELCISAFEQACRRQNAYGMIFHSDRGSQYTAYPNTEYEDGTLAEVFSSITINVHYKHFFHTLKNLLHHD